MQMIFDLVNPAELSLAARLLPQPAYTLNRFLPDDYRDSIDYRFTQQDRTRQRAGAYRAYDTPAVIRPRPGAAEIRGSLPPISVLVPLLEEEHLRLNGARAAGNAALVETLFDSDARIAARAVAARIEIARGQALSTGKVSIGTADVPENGLFIEVDYGLPAAHNITAPSLWSDGSTDILGQLQTWLETYRETSDGASPGVMIGSTAIRSRMLSNEGIRQLGVTVGGTPATVTPGQLDQVLTARDLPPFEVHDVKVRDHAGATVPVLPPDRLLFLPAPGAMEEERVGVTQFGRTLEADELVRLNVMDPVVGPGLVVVPMRSENPISYATLATAIALPTISAPELIFSVKVV